MIYLELALCSQRLMDEIDKVRTVQVWLRVRPPLGNAMFVHDVLQDFSTSRHALLPSTSRLRA
jgi:hypothetical protein